MSDSLWQKVISMIQEASPRSEIRQSILDNLTTVPLIDLASAYLSFREQLRKLHRDDLFAWLDGVEADIHDLYVQRRNQGDGLESSPIAPYLSVVFREHKEINTKGDKDLSDYLSSREKKMLAHSKKIYTRIEAKYPDHELRINLLRTLRTRQGLFGMFYLEGLYRLGKSLALKIQRTIQYLLRCFHSMDENTLSLLDRIQRAQRVLPANRSRAQEILSHLVAHSQTLNFHPKEFASIADVLSDYLGEKLFNQKSIVIILPQDEEEEEAPLQIATIRPASVQFAPEDLKAIVINPKITGTENITLTYCYQYWNRVQNPDFENKVYLYSLNHQSLHHQIFQIVKKTAMGVLKDEIMLYEIFNLLGRGGVYEYSVRKDIYMQSVWKRIKPVPHKEVIQDTRAYAEALVEKTRTEKEARKKAADAKTRKVIEKKLQGRNEALERAQIQLNNKAKGREMAAQRANETKRQMDQKLEGAKKRAESLHKVIKPVLQESEETQWASYNEIKLTTLSISQAVNSMDNSEQKNLHLIFRRNIEGLILDFVESFIRSRGLTIKPVNKTLAVISTKDFILRNYQNDERNWHSSNERLEVKELGLDITDIEPIITSCLESLLPEPERLVGT